MLVHSRSLSLVKHQGRPLSLLASQLSPPPLVEALALALPWPQIHHAPLLLTPSPWLPISLRSVPAPLPGTSSPAHCIDWWSFPDPPQFRPEKLEAEITQASPLPQPVPRWEQSPWPVPPMTSSGTGSRVATGVLLPPSGPGSLSAECLTPFCLRAFGL